jgi:TolA-binding protein
MKKIILLLLAASLSFPACVSARQGQVMVKKINDLNARVADMDKKVSVNYYEILMQAQQDIGQLKEIIERATKNLGENTADFALQIDKLRTDMASMQGKVEEISFALDTLARQVDEGKKDTDAKLDKYQKILGMDKPIEPSKIPADKDKHWQKAAAALKEKNYEEARVLFREYIKKYPDDPKCDEAQLDIGIAYLEEKNGAKALGELQKVIDQYPASNKMDAVLYFMGDAFFLIQNCADARTLYKAVITQFPKSPYKKKASAKINEILKAPKSVCPTIK